MSDSITLRAPKDLRASVRPPGSKSLTNRALALAAIAHGRSTIHGALDAHDSQLMRGCLAQLGVDVQEEDGALVIEGAAGAPRPDGVAKLDVGLAGTVARFLTGILAAGPGTARLDGTERMRERPMGMLVNALREQGAAIQCLQAEGHLPILIGPNYGTLKGGTITLSRPASSQFISALLIAATLAERPTTIVLEQGTPARPYVDMTLEALIAFGGEARWSQADMLRVEPTRLKAVEYEVEPDASGASYFMALAAIHGGEVRIDEIGSASVQGDAAFALTLEKLGAEIEQDDHHTIVRGGGRLQGGNFDLSDMPDMTLTLAVAAAHASGSTTITGVEVLRHHESDRIAAIATELRKLDVGVTEHDDGMTIEPPSNGLRSGVVVGSHGDHRMAMALSLVGDISIEGGSCVAKTYPRYFEELGNLGMVVAREG